MLEVPKRNSLVTQTVGILRRGIDQGEWTDALPGERVLSERLQISRPTLRLALEVLEREGRIETALGKKRLIICSGTRRSARGTTVGMVCAEPPHLLSPTAIFYMYELRTQLQEMGFQLQVFASKKLASKKPQKALRPLLDESKVACWVLIAVNEPVQRWFADHHLPALVAGSLYPGIRLPSLDLDYAAICRHAAGVFLRHGHRRTAIVVPDAGIAGDRTSEESFLDAIRSDPRLEVSGLAFRHDATREGILRVLNRMFNARKPPTALLVCHPPQVLTAVTVLMNRGLGIPNDVSVISRDSDRSMKCLHPDIARYSYRRRDFARRLARLVIQLATTGSLPKREHRLVPDFHSGASVAPPPTEPLRAND